MANLGPSDADDVCGVCGKPAGAHKNLAHVFNVEGRLVRRDAAATKSPSRADPSSQGSKGKLPTVDPIMRLILIRKGLVTAEEISQAEDELKSAGIIHANPDTRTNLGDALDRKREITDGGVRGLYEENGQGILQYL